MPDKFYKFWCLICIKSFLFVLFFVLRFSGVLRGLDVDKFAPRLSFFWGIGMNFYMVQLCFYFNTSNICSGGSFHLIVIKGFFSLLNKPRQPLCSVGHNYFLTSFEQS